MPRAGSYDVHLRLGQLLHKVRIITLAGGHGTVSAYIRKCIERCAEEDLKAIGGARLYMRPEQIVYKMDGEGENAAFTAITRTIGGERCWVIRSIGYLPASAGGKMAFMVDLTVEPGNAGCSATGVIVEAEGIIGK